MPAVKLRPARWSMLAVIMAALLVWGLYLAVGAVLYRRNFLPGMVVLGCMAAFLATWLLLLRLRASRTKGP